MLAVDARTPAHDTLSAHSLSCVTGVLVKVAAWRTGNAFVLINVVALRRARLVLGWVTVCGYTILVFNQSQPGLLSLAIPPWVGIMSTGGVLGHR